MRDERDHARDEALQFITHELRTPLVAIQGFAQFMMEYPNLRRESDAPNTIFRESRRLVALTNSYLDVLRIDAGASQIRSDTVNMSGVVRDVLELLQPLAVQARMTLRSEGDDAALVIGDAPLLTGAILNLVSNALKYGTPGTEVDIACSRHDGEVIVAVKNHGSCIDPPEVPRLFDPFYRSSRTEHNRPGSGLGLAFVRRIVEKHGGSVRVESKLPMTVFEVQLPAKMGITGL
jgi:signal transduction histidine kinase